MKTTIKAISITLALASFAVISSTQAKADVNPWQDCGIGSMIFPDNGTASAISNVIWDLGTTAVTSATASEDSCSSSRVKTAQFIQETYQQLEEDLVKGDGEHLSAMTELMSCSVQETAAIRDSLATSLATNDFADATQSDKAQLLFNNAERTCNAQL
jgi:hypothetical protein